MVNPATVIAAILTLIPFLAEAFSPGCLARSTQPFSQSGRLFVPSILCVPYILVAFSAGIFQWRWLALYALLPVAVAILLWQAKQVDPEQRGNWRDYLVLLTLGLAVDLRWFEHAWPARLSAFGKFLLLDAGIYGFLTLRGIENVGFDLRLRLRDVGSGLREFLFYAPIAIPAGLGLGFLHFHESWPRLPQIVAAFLFTFFFIAVPEEIYFRGWIQNLLERRLGRLPALLLTAVLFGLSHWNKRTSGFNWRYVLLALMAGIFYGRAWRSERRVASSATTHTFVDAIWSLWLR
jgi:uncharacterized protein